jgi:hypothetical protein
MIFLFLNLLYMKKSIIITSAVIAGVGLLAASTFAATGTSTLGSKLRWNMTQSGQVFRWHMDGNRWMNVNWPMGNNLTTAEKTAFDAMTTTEKQAFLEKKQVENQAKHDAHEVVIDKLLAGTALTPTEETLKQEMIKNRAEMKANKAKIETILAKKKAGTSLTAEEQALLDNMPKMGGKWMRGWHGMMMGGGRGNR